jgi:nucleoside-diphosphate-sugar epimerase
MRVCVTGACGFIGSELVKRLEKDGHEVIAVDSNDKYTSCKESYDWQEIYNTNDYNFLNDVDFIYLLGANSDTRETEEKIKISNIASPLKMIVEANHRNIPIVFASSASIYGERRTYKNKLSPQTPYAMSKFKVDNFINTDFAECNSLGKIACLRYHNVYGAYETPKGNMASIISKWIDNHINGISTNVLFYGSDKIKRDFIHVDDVNDINVMFLDFYIKYGQLPDNNTYDVGSGVATSFERVAKEIKKHTKCSIQYTINPYDSKNYQFYTKADIKNISDIYTWLYDKPYKPRSISEGVLNTLILKTETNVEQNPKHRIGSSHSTTPVQDLSVH